MVLLCYLLKYNDNDDHDDNNNDNVYIKYSCIKQLLTIKVIIITINQFYLKLINNSTITHELKHKTDHLCKYFFVCGCTLFTTFVQSTCMFFRYYYTL